MHNWPQNRSMMTLEENMEVVYGLEKENHQRVSAFKKKGIAVKHSTPQTSHCSDWLLKALTEPDHFCCKEMARCSN